MTKFAKKEMIKKALENDNVVYVHGLRTKGNGLKLFPNSDIYLSRYVESVGSYYGTFDIENLETLNIDWRRRIEIL